MELNKKTTILLSPDLHETLTRLAAQQGVSLGELVRRACEKQYRIFPSEDRLAAVRSLAALSLPVAEPKVMKKETVPTPVDLLPEL